jgi:hypothetical protein
MTVSRLEDLRDQPLVGEVAYRVCNGPLRPLLFHQHAHTAYYLTLDSLRSFEQSDAVGPGPFVVPAIAFWFLAVESYVSTLYKTCDVIADSVNRAELRQPADSPLHKTGKVVTKMMAVKEWITGTCPPDPPRNRLQEFTTFRNALFHDLTDYAPKTTYDHTQFAPRAEKCNQADLVEAVAISLEVFCYFRSVFYGADLMPSISLGPTVENLDVLADEVIYPAYQEILASKNLSSTVGSTKSLPCPAELRASLQFLIRSNGAMAHRATPLVAERIVDQHETAAIQARPTKDDVFHLPSYAR